mgnify:CR=1 FL=1
MTGRDDRGEMLSRIRRLSEELWPIARSVCGPGLRTSIGLLARTMSMEIIEVPTGSRVFDWTVPWEWELRQAQLLDESGAVVVSTRDSNLHVLNYSEPMHGALSGHDLKEHLYFDPDRPDVVPYRTSYYDARWGFCVDRSTFEGIREDEVYYVDIDTCKSEGSLTIGEAYLPGESHREIVFSSYLCHPSLAVNELSGPLTLYTLYCLLANEQNLPYSCRFVVSSETIGSLAYLSRNSAKLQDAMLGGAAIQMTGLPGQVIHRKCRHPSVFDEAIAIVGAGQEVGSCLRTLEWSPIGGGDQRQWTANGIDLPMSYISKTLRGDYREYHSSADNLELMDLNAIQDVAELLAGAVLSLDDVPLYRYVGPPGEPMLSKRRLMSTLGGPKGSGELAAIKVLIACADGTRSLTSMAEQFQLSVRELENQATLLLGAGLLERVP